MSGAAAAAAARRRREREEEEEMTGYSAQELAEGWEFKFVRSAIGAFRRPEFLKQVLEEEGRNGWTLVEKFDNGRIRLKRPASARRAEIGAGIDAYRSRVGISEVALALVIVAGVFGVLGAILGAIAAIAAALH